LEHSTQARVHSIGIATGRIFMRVFLGMILGAILTVVGAYLFDHLATRPATSASENAPQTMVNWDVVGRNWQSVKLQLNQGWIKLSSLIAR
jgi:hypothetical protein